MEQEKAKEYVKKLFEISSEINKFNEGDDNFIENQFIKILEEHKFKSSYTMEREVMKYFLAIFANVTSNSVLLWEDKISSYNKESIASGKYGFGIRERKQSKPINTFGELSILKKHSKEVVDALNDRRKWRKAEELENFFDIIEFEELENELKLEIQLELNLLLPCSQMENMIKYDKLRISINDNNRISLRLLGDNGKSLTIESIGDIRYNDEIITKISLLTNFILKDQIEGIVKTFTNFVIKVSKERKDMSDILNKEFGKYIMAQNL